MQDLISNQLIKYLENRGIKHIFGLCGHTNIAVLAALSKSTKIKFINTRHEQIAAHAADGYARATKKASVLLAHLSPGMTNATTGVANAALDSIPMVVIVGDVPSHYYGKHPHQEVNLHADASQSEIYRPFVKRVWRVDSAHLFPEILEKAFTLAESGRPGPVLIDVPMDIFSKEIDVALFDRVQTNLASRQLAKPSLDEETAEKIVQQLLAAKTPLLYVGGGILLADCAQELREFAEHLALPVAHTLMGKGALPDDHPLILGMTGFWGTHFINEKCKGADWILGLGTRFSEADCSSWEPEYTFNFPPTKLMHIDIDPAEIGRNYPVEIGAVADLKAALRALLRVARKICPEGLQRPALLAEMASNRVAFVAGNKAAMESNAWPMRPERILADLRAALPRNAIICTDVGWNKNGLGQQFPVLEAGTVFTPGGFATMGFGSPAALGAKVALPDRVVVALVGDGGFGQNPAALATAFEEDIAVIWVIMNNHAFGTIAGLEKAHYDTTFGTLFEKNGVSYSPDYAAIARAYGVEGIKIESAAELKPALEKAMAMKVPVVIDVYMKNEPVPTAGHWNIMDIYSPNKKVHHVSTDN